MHYIFRIIKFAKKLWPYYTVISLLTIAVSLVNLIMPAVSGWAIDEIRKGNTADMHKLIFFAVLILIADVLFNILNNVNGYFGDQVNVKLNHYLSYRYYEHLLKLDQNFFDTELSGKIVNRLNRSVIQISNFINAVSNNFLQFLFSTIFSLAIVFFYSWQVGLMLLTIYPIYIWFTFRSSQKWQSYQKKKNKYSDIASGRFIESISQIKVVKSFVQESRELKFLDTYLKKVITTNKPQSIYWHKRDTIRRFVLNFIFFLVYLYIFYQGAHGLITPGATVALILYSIQIRMPIFTISFLVDSTQKAIADSKDFFEIMEKKPIQDNSNLLKLEISDGEVFFDKVAFGYDDKKVLKDIDFVIKPKTKIALVGESGVGKTTITNLLMKLYAPTKGAILIDGQDISEYDQQSVRNNIGVVFQDPSLFSGTISENIAYANPKADKKDIIAASKAANADEFIKEFAEGYESQIGEHGIKLSGGQKQRIAIARALLKNPKILILDEATSSLDSKSEILVQRALKELMKDRTTIIIAHRLSTIANVDQIITIKDGNVDEIGTPKQLAKSGGIYSQLLELQEGKVEEKEEKLKLYDINES